MLEYDLTQTALFDCASRKQLPTEAEMFAITAALLLVHDAAYADLARRELHFSQDDIVAVAESIEYRLSPLARDFMDAERLRHRLRDFVGLRICGIGPHKGCAPIQHIKPSTDQRCKAI